MVRINFDIAYVCYIHMLKYTIFEVYYVHLPDSIKQLTFDLATKDILQCPRTLFSSLIKIRHVGKLSQDTFRDFILQYNNKGIR